MQFSKQNIPMKTRKINCLISLTLFIVPLHIRSYGQEWKPSAMNLTTKWTSEVTPMNVWEEYPRPQLKRDKWINLNGLWDYAVRPDKDTRPDEFDGKILVPFSIEAPLSGVGRQIEIENAIWYRKEISLPSGWKDMKILIHFEASDFETTVWVNGSLAGSHKGGYNPFSFDISRFTGPGETSELLVKVHDPHKTIFSSLGKQVEYGNFSGIWQTVWIEPVPEEASVASLKITPETDSVTITTLVDNTDKDIKTEYIISDNNRVVGKYLSEINAPFRAQIADPKLWSPDSPHLYDLKVRLVKGDKVIDEVSSYFGLRVVSKGKSAGGSQFLLNGKPIFQYGPLDQNYWPDGGFTPPSDKAMKWELEYLKSIGCNMVRPHVKVNPRRYYYHADRLGLLVWQDFVCAHGKNPSKADSDFWLHEQKLTIESLYNHPSVVVWVVFNESWGQHDSEKIIQWAADYDKSRLIIGASGWNDVPQKGDIRDVHDYTMRPAIPVASTDERILVLGESGGFVSAVSTNNWYSRSNPAGRIRNLLYGGFPPTVPRDDNEKHDLFRPTFTMGEPFAKQYSVFINHLSLLRNSGLSAAVYTQLTDMKSEENGWLTFDRRVGKVEEKRLAEIHRVLFSDPPSQKIIFGSSASDNKGWEIAYCSFPEGFERTDEEKPSNSYTIQEAPDFKAQSWTVAKGPFPANDKNRELLWNGDKQLLVRKAFTLEEVPENASIRIYTVKPDGISNFYMYTKIFINGVFVADEATRQMMPESRMAEVILPGEAIALLKKGMNEVTVQFISGYNTRDAQFSPVSEKVTIDFSMTSF
jgi:hypothetical protein